MWKKFDVLVLLYEYHLGMRLQDAEDPANGQEVVSGGTSAGLKFEQSVKSQPAEARSPDHHRPGMFFI